VAAANSNAWFYYGTVTSSGSKTISLSDPNATYWGAGASEFSGVDATVLVDSVCYWVGNYASPLPVGPLHPTAAGQLAFIGNGNDGGVSTVTTAGSPWTAGTGISNSGSGSAFGNTDWLITTSASTLSPSYAYSPGGNDVTTGGFVLPPLAITRATGFPIDEHSDPTTATVSWATIGDLAILDAFTYHNDTAQITSVSSSKVSGWHQVVRGTQTDTGKSVNTTDSIWIGTVIGAGSDTIYITWNANPANFEVVVDELNGGLGPSTTWTVIASNSLTTTSNTSYSYPSLTSGSIAKEAYWGHATADPSSDHSLHRQCDSTFPWPLSALASHPRPGYRHQLQRQHRLRPVLLRPPSGTELRRLLVVGVPLRWAAHFSGGVLPARMRRR
jgi:hypothetical protein